MKITRRQLRSIIISSLNEGAQLNEGPHADCDTSEIQKKKYALDTKISLVYNKLLNLAGKDVEKVKALLSTAENFNQGSVMGRFISKLVAGDSNVGSEGGKMTTTTTSKTGTTSYKDTKTKMIPKSKSINEEAGEMVQAAGLASKVIQNKAELGKMGEDVYKALSDLVQSMGPNSGCKWGGTSTDSDIYKEEEFEFFQAIDRNPKIPDDMKDDIKTIVAQFQETSY